MCMYFNFVKIYVIGNKSNFFNLYLGGHANLFFFTIIILKLLITKIILCPQAFSSFLSIL